MTMITMFTLLFHCDNSGGATLSQCSFESRPLQFDTAIPHQTVFVPNAKPTSSQVAVDPQHNQTATVLLSCLSVYVLNITRTV